VRIFMPVMWRVLSDEMGASLGPYTLLNEAHVWLARPDIAASKSVRQAYEALLSDDERLRYRQFRFERDQRLYLVAHALVRTTLSRYANLEPQDWQFSTNRYGRPEVLAAQATQPPMRFNLSHTHGLVACLVTQSLDCGVDVESGRELEDIMSVAKIAFSADEFAALSGLPKHERHERFYQYWTLKESYIKARGMGISLPLGEFGFQFDGHELIGVNFAACLEDEPADWQFCVGSVGPSAHTLAVALRRGGGPDLPVVCRHTQP
jgi:4'-phosphopantetheinyl transferase